MIPNCQFINDVIVFGTSKKGMYVSKGFLIETPDKSGASEATREELRLKLTRMLAMILRDGFDLQVKRSFDSDYSQILSDYRDGSGGGNRWSDLVRGNVATVYDKAIESNFLRREYMQIYVGCWYRPSDKKICGDKVETYLRTLESLFKSVYHVLKMAFDDGKVVAMKERDYFERYFKMWNKGFRTNFHRDIGPGAYVPEMTMQDNCMLGDFHEPKDGISGLEIDGYHHGFLTFARWPDSTLPLMAKRLTDMSINDFDITFTLYATDIEKEKMEGKSVLKSLKNSEDIEEQEMAFALDEKMRSITRGAVVPVYGVYIVTIWSRDLEDLKIQMDAAKTNIMAMDGALYYSENSPKKAREIFYMSFPGWMGSNYAKNRKLYGEASYASDLLPISSSFNGRLEGPQILFDGDEGSLVGIKLFEKSTPLHFCMFGTTRAGKSVGMIAMLSQIYPILGYACIVESGNSYLTWVKAQGDDAESIVISPNGTLTINYFDTMGLPLTSEQINNAVGLLMCIIGASADEDKNAHRQALLTAAVIHLYEDKFNQWRSRNLDLFKKVRHAAVVVNRIQHTLPQGANSYIEAWKEMVVMHEKFPDSYERLWNEVTESEISEFEKNPRTSMEVMNLAYSQFSPEEFPTHGNFVENMRVGEGGGASKELFVQLAELLEQWRRNGPNGPLIDGPSTVRIDKRVVHFELGLIPEANNALRNVAGFLINNMVRNHVQSLPRGIKKMFVFEELSRFLNIPGADKIIKETFAQMGKFACCVGTVTQQYAQFLENDAVAKVCIGNASQFFLLKNKREDLTDLAERINLPDSAIDRVVSFPRPVDLPPEDRYSSFLYFSAIGMDNIINGVCRIYATPELLYVADSEGAEFQNRMDELRGAEGDIVGKVIEIVRSRELQNS